MKWLDLLSHLNLARERLRTEQPEFTKELDSLRSYLRSAHGKELHTEVAEDNELRVRLTSMIGAPEPKPWVSPDPQPVAPEHVPIPEHSIQDVVYRGDGEGRMVILKRETPLVVRPPDLVEVTEEELAK